MEPKTALARTLARDHLRCGGGPNSRPRIARDRAGFLQAPRQGCFAAARRNSPIEGMRWSLCLQKGPDD